MNELEDELERHDELEDESKLTVRIAPEVFQKFKAAVQETLSGTAENHTSGMILILISGGGGGPHAPRAARSPPPTRFLASNEKIVRNKK